MERHAWLVNVARGRHVVTDDLVAALRERRHRRRRARRHRSRAAARRPPAVDAAELHHHPARRQHAGDGGAAAVRADRDERPPVRRRRGAARPRRRRCRLLTDGGEAGELDAAHDRRAARRRRSAAGVRRAGARGDRASTTSSQATGLTAERTAKALARLVDGGLVVGERRRRPRGARRAFQRAARQALGPPAARRARRCARRPAEGARRVRPRRADHVDPGDAVQAAWWCSTGWPRTSSPAGATPRGWSTRSSNAPSGHGRAAPVPRRRGAARPDGGEYWRSAARSRDDIALRHARCRAHRVGRRDPGRLPPAARQHHPDRGGERDASGWRRSTRPTGCSATPVPGGVRRGGRSTRGRGRPPPGRGDGGPTSSDLPAAGPVSLEVGRGDGRRRRDRCPDRRCVAEPGTDPPPDNVLEPGSCVMIEANRDAREVDVHGERGRARRSPVSSRSTNGCPDGLATDPATGRVSGWRASARPADRPRPRSRRPPSVSPNASSNADPVTQNGTGRNGGDW